MSAGSVTPWDEDILRLELGDLRDEGFDLGLTGFDLDEIGKLLIDATDGLTDPDDVPEVPESPSGKELNRLSRM